jgi:bifunctional DNA-binding transcriptional regulator/antitoxin component of YhaV-PrlF toxin-antitoxin module
MEQVVGIDKQGRMVIPASMRVALGIVEGCKALVRLDGRRLIVEVVDEDLERRVAEWRGMALSLHAEALTEEVEESWRWMSREYAERKLGVH